MRDVGNAEAHFNTTQCCGQHQIVEVTKMSDPENPAGKLGKPVPERHVEMLQNRRAEGIGIVTFRHENSGQRALE